MKEEACPGGTVKDVMGRRRQFHEGATRRFAEGNPRPLATGHPQGVRRLSLGGMKLYLGLIDACNERVCSLALVSQSFYCRGFRVIVFAVQPKTMTEVSLPQQTCVHYVDV